MLAVYCKRDFLFKKIKNTETSEIQNNQLILIVHRLTRQNKQLSELTIFRAANLKLLQRDFFLTFSKLKSEKKSQNFQKGRPLLAF